MYLKMQRLHFQMVLRGCCWDDKVLWWSTTKALSAGGGRMLLGVDMDRLQGSEWLGTGEGAGEGLGEGDKEAGCSDPVRRGFLPDPEPVVEEFLF